MKSGTCSGLDPVALAHLRRADPGELADPLHRLQDRHAVADELEGVAVGGRHDAPAPPSRGGRGAGSRRPRSRPPSQSTNPNDVDERRQHRELLDGSRPRTRGPTGTPAAPRCGRSARRACPRRRARRRAAPPPTAGAGSCRSRRARWPAGRPRRGSISAARGTPDGRASRRRSRAGRPAEKDLSSRASIAYPDAAAIVAHRAMADQKSNRKAADARDRRVPGEGEDDRGLPREGLHGRVVDRPHPRPAAQRGRGSGRHRSRSRGRGSASNVDHEFEPLYVVDPKKKAVVTDLKREAEERRRAPARDRRRPRRRGDRLAPRRGAEAEGARPADGLPRDHEAGDRARARRDPRDRRPARRRAGDPPHPRPALRLRGLARALAEGDEGPLGRAASSRSRPGSSSSASASGSSSAPPSTGTSSATFDPGALRCAPGRGRRPPGRAGPRLRPQRRRSRPTDAVQLDEERRALPRRGARRRSSFTVRSVERKPYTRRPAAPFMTSTLQQEASRKLRFSAQHTMRVAQRLYENGYITYMRTDSTSLSESAIAAARDQARTLYGADSVPAEPRHYNRKVKNAQEAHEAIRPAGDSFRPPDAVRARGRARRGRALRPDLEAHGRLADGRRPRRDRLGARSARPRPTAAMPSSAPPAP